MPRPVRAGRRDRARARPRRAAGATTARCGPWRAGDVDVVAAGLTGFAGEIEAVAAAVPAPRVVATNDAVTAHLGALGGEPGVVIVAGTGVDRARRGRGRRAGRAPTAAGTLLGDDGGGYWIGRAGLARRAPRPRRPRRLGRPAGARRGELRCDAGAGGDGRDGRARARRDGAAARPGLDRSPALGQRRGRAGRAAGGTGIACAPGIVPPSTTRPIPSRSIASFARDVADAARAGRGRAGDLERRPARELARTALAAAPTARGVDGPFSFAGGLFAAGDLLLDPLRGRLAGELRAPLGDALDGAARLLERPPLFAT